MLSMYPPPTSLSRGIKTAKSTQTLQIDGQRDKANPVHPAANFVGPRGNDYIDGLVQDCSISNALAMEILCTVMH